MWIFLFYELHRKYHVQQEFILSDNKLPTSRENEEKRKSCSAYVSLWVQFDCSMLVRLKRCGYTINKLFYDNKQSWKQQNNEKKGKKSRKKTYLESMHCCVNDAKPSQYERIWTLNVKHQYLFI